MAGALSKKLIWLTIQIDQPQQQKLNYYIMTIGPYKVAGSHNSPRTLKKKVLPSKRMKYLSRTTIKLKHHTEINGYV